MDDTSLAMESIRDPIIPCDDDTRTDGGGGDTTEDDDGDDDIPRDKKEARLEDSIILNARTLLLTLRIVRLGCQ